MQNTKLRIFVTKLISGAACAAVFAGWASATTMSCTVPNTVVLDIIPTGCDVTMTNAPLTFTGVVANNGDSHNVEFDALEFFNMNTDSSSVRSVCAGSIPTQRRRQCRISHFSIPPVFSDESELDYFHSGYRKRQFFVCPLD